jgi:hypothetical protein
VWFLPLLQVVWVNSHTLFVFGPVLAWIFTGGAILQNLATRAIGWPEGEREASRRAELRAGTLVIVAILVSLACAVNPYGLRGAMFPLVLLQEIHKSSVLGTAIDEFRSPFDLEQIQWPLCLSVGLVIASLVTFIVNWRRIDIASVAIWAAMVYLAAVALRNVGLLAVAATWAGLVNIQLLLDQTRSQARVTKVTQELRPLAAAAHVVMGLLLIVAAWQIAADRLHVRMGPQQFGLKLADNARPEQATAFLLRERDIQPNIFHDMADASWLIWQAHNRFPVFVDGRLEVYGEQFLGKHLNMDDVAMDQVIEERGVNVIVARTDSMGGLASRLVRSPEWSLVHLDSRNLVFVRNIPPHEAVIAQWRIDPEEPWSPRDPEPTESLASWQQLIGARARPTFESGMVRAFLTIGAIDNAETYARRGLARFPDNAEFQLTLAQILRSRGRSVEAEELTVTAAATPAKARLFTQATKAIPSTTSSRVQSPS